MFSGIAHCIVLYRMELYYIEEKTVFILYLFNQIILSLHNSSTSLCKRVFKFLLLLPV